MSLFYFDVDSAARGYCSRFPIWPHEHCYTSPILSYSKSIFVLNVISHYWGGNGVPYENLRYALMSNRKPSQLIIDD